MDHKKGIAGMSNLLNTKNNSTDITKLEKEILNDEFDFEQEEEHISKRFERDMDNLTKTFDFSEIKNLESNEIDIDDDLDGVESSLEEDHVGGGYNTGGTAGFGSGGQSAGFGGGYGAGGGSYGGQNAGFGNTGFGSGGDADRWTASRPYDSQLKNMTIEEKKQNYINNVLEDLDDGEIDFDINKEKEEDDKNSLLEQIDMLRITLEDEGVEMGNIPKVNKDNNMEDIQNVYKILRLKNDRNRYCSFANELILAGAYGLEYLFDGEKEWFGRKPDLVGWSETVKVKLRRMRYETSTFVQEVMQEYNMSPGVRLMIELIPSMFFYSRNRKIAQKDNLAQDNQYQNAISNLNSQMI